MKKKNQPTCIRNSLRPILKQKSHPSTLLALHPPSNNLPQRLAKPDPPLRKVPHQPDEQVPPAAPPEAPLAHKQAEHNLARQPVHPLEVVLAVGVGDALVGGAHAGGQLPHRPLRVGAQPDPRAAPSCSCCC